MVAILVPFPLLIFWFGASMLVYAMNRHHPNPKVGHYTQQAAYRFYGVTGFFVVVATFIPGGGWIWYLTAWTLAALVLIPCPLWICGASIAMSGWIFPWTMKAIRWLAPSCPRVVESGCGRGAHRPPILLQEAITMNDVILSLEGIGLPALLTGTQQRRDRAVGRK